MQHLVSRTRELCDVQLPYDGRRHYMHEFDIAKPTVPKGFEDYLPVVKRIVNATGVKNGIAFLTVDEKIVKAGNSQRRPGPHVDGCFDKGKQRWGHGQGGWNHFCNFLPVERMPVIVAASVVGCKVWEGEFYAEPRNDGDLSHLELPEGVLVPSNKAIWLSPDCIHESLRFDQDTQRSFLRIAMPVGSFN